MNTAEALLSSPLIVNNEDTKAKKKFSNLIEKPKGANAASAIIAQNKYTGGPSKAVTKITANYAQKRADAAMVIMYALKTTVAKNKLKKLKKIKEMQDERYKKKQEQVALKNRLLQKRKQANIDYSKKQQWMGRYIYIYIYIL